LNVTSRVATAEDLDTLAILYGGLEREQADLKPMWPLFDGLDEPFAGVVAEILNDRHSILLVGEIDEVPLGMLWARSEPMLDRAQGERVGVVRLIYTDPEARGVGVAEAMVTDALSRLRASGHRRFDASVSPGHRAAKNFFEANGFAARLIVMHHDDRRKTKDERQKT
jgi:ribosomal protein S18 acetylase RimI-like enzyme